MKRYITPATSLAALLSGVAAGVAASFFLAPLRSVLIGTVVALLAFFAIPSHFYAGDAVFHAKAKELGTLDLNEPVLIVTSKKTYRARLCATKEKITLLFRFKGQIVPLVFHREDGISLFVTEDGFVSLTSKSPERGAFFTSAPLLANIAEVAKTLKTLGY